MANVQSELTEQCNKYCLTSNGIDRRSSYQ